MADRIVAADASPLIGLAASGAFHLLRSLFGSVTVTEAVRDEVLAGGVLPGASELREAIAAGWIQVVPAPTGSDTFPELGAGEASTLALALEQPTACLVLMDEAAGRSHAREQGLQLTGLVGVLLAAWRAGKIQRLGPLFASLERSDFRIAPDLVRVVLEETGEA